MKGERIGIACLRIACFLITILCVSGCGKQSEEKKEPLTILTTHINYEKFVEALDKKYPGIKKMIENYVNCILFGIHVRIQAISKHSWFILLKLVSVLSPFFICSQ